MTADLWPTNSLDSSQRSTRQFVRLWSRNSSRFCASRYHLCRLAATCCMRYHCRDLHNSEFLLVTVMKNWLGNFVVSDAL